MTEKTTIAVHYDPEDAEKEFGWLWLSDCEGWRLVYTWLPDGIDAEPKIRVLQRPGEDPDDEVYAAEDWTGKPYIPCTAPACEPGDGALLVAHYPGGATVSLSVRPGPGADRVREAVARLVADMSPDRA